MACQFRKVVNRSLLGTPSKLAFGKNEQPIIRPYRPAIPEITHLVHKIGRLTMMSEHQGKKRIINIRYRRNLPQAMTIHNV